MVAGKTLAPLWLLFAVACSPADAGLDPAREAVLESEVQEALDGLTDAMNSHDPEQIFRYFRGDQEFLYLGCTDVLLGWEPYARRATIYSRANPDVTFTREVIRIQVLSPTTAVAALQGGSTLAEALFWTEVLVKEGGEWTVTYEHESWPGCSPPTAPHPFTTGGSMPGESSPDGG